MNDIVVKFPTGLTCYKTALEKVLDVAPSIGNPRSVVLQFKTLEDAEEKYEQFQALDFSEGLVSFTKPANNSDPLSKVVYIGKDKPDAEEFLKTNLGAISAIEMKRKTRGIGLYVVKFNTIEDAEAAMKKNLTYRGVQLKFDNCRSAPKRAALESLSEDAPAKKLKTDGEGEEVEGEGEEENAAEEDNDGVPEDGGENTDFTADFEV